MRAGPLLLLAAVLTLAACDTNEQAGKVGDALKGKHVQAKLLEYVPTVPKRLIPRHDVTGLNVPAQGNRFAAVNVALCNNTGAAALAWRFELRLQDGTAVHPQTTTSVYEKMLEPVRDGCDRGWLVYQIPAAAKAKTLYYEFDYSEQVGQPSSGAVSEEHDRFTWSL